jgi:hypothetical protein
MGRTQGVAKKIEGGEKSRIGADSRLLALAAMLRA